MSVTVLHTEHQLGLVPTDGSLRVIGIGDLLLESGAVLLQASMAVQVWGTPSPSRDNVVLALHALTGDSHVTGPAGPDHPTPGWWNRVVGPDAPLDTNRWCVVAANVLGGCRGSSGPSSPRPAAGTATGTAWGSDFPWITIRDQVAAEAALLDVLGVPRLAAVFGGSMGGMRALEWAVSYPERVGAALILATGARATGDQIGTQTAQMQAITADPDWQGGNYFGTSRRPDAGLNLARQIAHLTYRGEVELDERFGNSLQEPGMTGSVGARSADLGGPAAGLGDTAQPRYAVASYLRHQGSKLTARFDPASYVLLCEAMNRHDVGRGRGGVAAALAGCPVPTIVAGVDSDRLYPLRLQAEIAAGLPGCAGLDVVHSRSGHDGFLTEFAAISELVVRTLALSEAAR